jgi:uncharacterized membrane protein YfcA
LSYLKLKEELLLTSNNLDLQHLELFIFLALIAEIVGTLGGFGSSIFFVPIAGLFLDFQSVLGITALFHLSSNVTKIAMFRKGFNKKLLIRMGIPAVIFVFAGAYLSQFVANNNLQIILSVFLILFSLLMLLYPRFRLKPTKNIAVLGGGFSGMAAGLLGTGGAIRGLVLAAFALEKNVFIATSAIIDLGIDLTRSLVYFENGFMHRQDLYLIPILFVVGILGTYIGKSLLQKFSELQFQKLVLALILCTGIFTILRSV